MPLSVQYIANKIRAIIKWIYTYVTSNLDLRLESYNLIELCFRNPYCYSHAFGCGGKFSSGTPSPLFPTCLLRPAVPKADAIFHEWQYWRLHHHDLRALNCFHLLILLPLLIRPSCKLRSNNNFQPIIMHILLTFQFVFLNNLPHR